MDYLTASEISKMWNISSRMVAYYCEAERINGAVKKGKVWFIPADAEKPVDKRYSKRKIKSVDSSLSGKIHSVGDIDIDNISTIYRTSDVYNNLGFSRETLRYYEEIGLIKPKRSKYSQYREFDFFDMSHLMAIDFFKKRGFATAEVKELLKASTAKEYAEIMQQKIDFMRRKIDDLHSVLKRLEETKSFYDYTSNTIDKFTIKELPPYYIQESISSVLSFDEYRAKVLNYLNLENEDILSNMVRAITFDKSGYKTSGMYIVKPIKKERQTEQKRFLEYGKCLYTTLIADNNDTSIMEKMFVLCHEWAKQHNISFRGVVYIFIRFVMLDEHTDKNCYEIWIPLK